MRAAITAALVCIKGNLHCITGAACARFSLLGPVGVEVCAARALGGPCETGDTGVGVLGRMFSGSEPAAFAVLDLETTGLSPLKHRIVEAAVVHVDAAGNITGRWSSIINPQGTVRASQIHGIYDADVAHAPTFAEAAPALLAQLRGRVVVTHNVPFDLPFLQQELARAGAPAVSLASICTLAESRRFLPEQRPRKLAACCATIGFPLRDAHEALADAEGAAALLSFYLRKRALHIAEWKHAAAVARTAQWPHLPLSPAPTWTRSDAARTRSSAEATARAVLEVEAAAERDRRSLAAQYLAGGRGATISGISTAVDAYLEVLDGALEDRVLTDGERQDLADASRAAGLTRAEVVAAHRLYLAALAAAVVADGRVDEEERADLTRVAKLLRVRTPTVDELLSVARTADDEGHRGLLARGVPLAPGMKVLIHGDTAVDLPALKRRAASVGLSVTSTARGRVDLLVIADPEGSADRALWARENRVRVVIEPVFLALLSDAEAASLAAPTPPRQTQTPETSVQASVHLQQGQTTQMSDLLVGEACRLQLTWTAAPGVDADVMAVLTRGGQASGDDDLVFFNQPAHPSGAATLLGKSFTGPVASDTLQLDLAALPDDVDKLVLVASLDAEGSTFADIEVCRLAVLEPSSGASVAAFDLPKDGNAAAVTAMVVAEVYRHRGTFKLRAVGQGYAEGLRALVTDYGIDVS